MTNNIDLATAIAHRDAWIAADLALASGQSYSIGNRQLSRTDAAEVRKQIGFWQNAVKSLSASATSGVSGGPAVATFT